MGNIIKKMRLDKRDELKRKLQDADNSRNNVDLVSILQPPQVRKTQDNLEDPEGREDSNMLEASKKMNKLSDLCHENNLPAAKRSNSHHVVQRQKM